VASPVPKRSDERRRTNSVEPDIAPAGAPIRWPAPAPWWNDRAREFYRALRKSGQSRFYEQSDVIMARVACDLLTNFARVPNPATIDSFQRICVGLMVTEGDRRRHYLELRRQVDESKEKRVRGSDHARAALGLVQNAG
jgi:hypothetical protein